MSRPTISLRVNNDLPAGTLLALASAAERAGVDQLWVSNDLMLRSAPALLGALATRTQRLTLGIGIMNPVTVHPAELAMLAATLQELSGGRFALGLGAGAAQFLAWVGLDQPTPLRTTREALAVLRALLAGEVPEVPGWTPDAHLRFDAPAPPVYLAATSPKMLALAGAAADGVLALALPPSSYPAIRDQVTAGAVQADRDPAEVDLPACLWLSLDADARGARRALAEKVAYYGSAFSPHLLGRLGLTPGDFAQVDEAVRAGGLLAGAALVDDRMLGLGLWGDPAQVVDGCRQVLAADATHLSFGPPLGPDPVAAVAQLGDQVLPALDAPVLGAAAPVGAGWEGAAPDGAGSDGPAYRSPALPEEEGR